MSTIRLLPIGPEIIEANRTSPEALADVVGAPNPDPAFVTEIIAQTANLYDRDPRPMPWVGYLVVDDTIPALVGTCGYKSGPTASPGRSVEIAYCTLPPFEGRGYASSMAALLVVIAETSRQVDRVIAHTLPEKNASGRILEKTGLTFTGDVIDPDDGPVWRWEKAFDVPT
jgi:[ribosomal protein S5]-alanine N-acetyltransferase